MQDAPTASKRPFSPTPLFRQDGKEGGAGGMTKLEILEMLHLILAISDERPEHIRLWIQTRKLFDARTPGELRMQDPGGEIFS